MQYNCINYLLTMALYDNISIGKRLTEFRERELGLSKTEFGEPAGLKQAHIYQLEIGRNKKIMDKLESIFQAYPSLNREWLLYGHGEMLQPETKPNPNRVKTEYDLIKAKLASAEETIELQRKMIDLLERLNGGSAKK